MKRFSQFKIEFQPGVSSIRNINIQQPIKNNDWATGYSKIVIDCYECAVIIQSKSFS